MRINGQQCLTFTSRTCSSTLTLFSSSEYISMRFTWLKSARSATRFVLVFITWLIPYLGPTSKVTSVCFSPCCKKEEIPRASLCTCDRAAMWFQLHVEDGVTYNQGWFKHTSPIKPQVTEILQIMHLCLQSSQLYWRKGEGQWIKWTIKDK